MKNQDKIHQAVKDLLTNAYNQTKMTPTQRQQAQHNAAIKKAKEQQERFQKLYQQATWTCEHCQTEHKPRIVKDTQSKREIAIRVSECDCEQANLIAAQKRLEEFEQEKQRHIDWLIYNQKWLEFNTDWTGNEKAKAQLEYARDTVLKAYIDKRTGILISGPVGSGKTHLARAFYQAYGTQGKRVSFYTEPDIALSLRKKYDKDESVMLHKCQIADILVFDDIGAEKFNQQTEWLHYLLQSFYFKIFERRQLDKITFMTTNLKSEDMRDHVGKRAADRMMHILRDNSNIVKLWDVPSYRSKDF